MPLFKSKAARPPDRETAGKDFRAKVNAAIVAAREVRAALADLNHDLEHLAESLRLEMARMPRP